MTTGISEQRPLYGIGTVARLAGVKPDTLRVWERRYALGASQKSETGRRLYTQTDLEHLQIVAKLLGQGFRIGEVAAMERKTLEAMLEQGRSEGNSGMARPRPGVLFVGENLCNWLDSHPGCLSGLNSGLLRYGPEDAMHEPEVETREQQLLVVESPALGNGQVAAILDLYGRSKAVSGMVFYEFASQRNLKKLTDAGLGIDQLPLKTDKFAAGLRKMVSLLEVRQGAGDAGELAIPQPRLFRDGELQSILNEASSLNCGCAHHLSEIITSLANFEQYSSQCSVDSWSDAATHSCVYAYTNQARWLMEKALAAVLEEDGAVERRNA